MTRLFAIFLCFLATPAYADAAGDMPAAANPRNVFEVSYSDAEDAVGNALNAKGVGDKISVTITGRKDRVLFAYEKPVTVEVRGLQFEKRDRRWSASLLFVADGEVISALPAAGRFAEVIEVPVLKREIRNGGIISESDIEVRDFQAAQVRSDTVTDISGLIGKSPLHSISASRPIRAHEISNPAVVRKNSLVQIHYSSPGMLITTTGQALTDGARGDVINIRNTESKKIVRAVVENSNMVSIVAPGVETSELTGATYATN